MSSPDEQSKGVADYLVEDRPDWSKIDFDLECPRCGYNLRMLESPRCPECGLDVDWPNLIDARFSRSKFLFEHHWRTRPLGSWFQTAIRSLLPLQFWSQVSLYDRVHPRPLFAYLCLAPFICILSLHLGAWIGFQLFTLLFSQMSLPPTMQSIGDALEELASSRGWRWRSRDFIAWHFCFGCMLFVSLGLMMILRETLGRCRVRPVQVMRAVAYGSYPVAILTPWWSVIADFVLDLAAPSGLLSSAVALERWAILYPVILTVVVCVPMAMIMGIGFRDYLRLPRPFILAGTTTLVGLLSGL